MNVGTMKRVGSLAAVAAVAALASAAWAQERVATAPPPARTADTTLAEWLADKDARISELIGRRVIGAGGADLGEIEDLLAKAGQEQDPVVVLSIGGFLDLGDKWHAVSLGQLKLAADGERLTLDKTEAELEAAPNFDYLPMMGEDGHLPGVRGPLTTNAIGRLLGATVVDDSGASLGEIEDFVISTGAEGIRAVVELEEIAAGAQRRRVAIPYASLAIELSGEEAAAIPQQPRVRVNPDVAPLESLPRYEYPQRELI